MPKIVGLRYLDKSEYKTRKTIYDLTVDKNHNYVLANGQVVHNSGKGFAIKNFLDASSYKVRDVDYYKELYLRLDKYPELRNMNLRNPDDVFKLHKFVDEKGIKDKVITGLLRDTQQSYLPNILLDVTLKNMKEVNKLLPLFNQVGYQKENIHIVWVLTNYEIAVHQNRKRSRVVPEDILLQTHEGAANTMYDMVFRGKYPYRDMNGGVWVILNGPQHTVLWNPDTAAKTNNFVIKDFKYLLVKRPGAAIKKGDVQNQLYTWVVDNIPKSKSTEKIFTKEELEALEEAALADLLKKHNDPLKFATEALKLITSGELKLKTRGASNLRELVAMFYKHKKQRKNSMKSFKHFTTEQTSPLSTFTISKYLVDDAGVLTMGEYVEISKFSLKVVPDPDKNDENRFYWLYTLGGKQYAIQLFPNSRRNKIMKHKQIDPKSVPSGGTGYKS